MIFQNNAVLETATWKPSKMNTNKFHCRLFSKLYRKIVRRSRATLFCCANWNQTANRKSSKSSHAHKTSSWFHPMNSTIKSKWLSMVVNIWSTATLNWSRVKTKTWSKHSLHLIINDFNITCFYSRLVRLGSLIKVVLPQSQVVVQFDGRTCKVQVRRIAS